MNFGKISLGNFVFSWLVMRLALFGEVIVLMLLLFDNSKFVFEFFGEWGVWILVFVDGAGLLSSWFILIVEFFMFWIIWVFLEFKFLELFVVWGLEVDCSDVKGIISLLFVFFIEEIFLLLYFEFIFFLIDCICIINSTCRLMFLDFFIFFAIFFTW